MIRRKLALLGTTVAISLSATVPAFAKRYQRYRHCTERTEYTKHTGREGRREDRKNTGYVNMFCSQCAQSQL